jgi:hypothetical protein
MLELLEGLKAWQVLIVALAVYGFLPGVALRIILLAFRRNDPRRAEILAELRAVPRWDRPIWVAEQLEVALFEGLVERIKSRLTTSRRRTVPSSLGNPVVFTRTYARGGSTSGTTYRQGTSGLITRIHTDRRLAITHVDVRLPASGVFLREVPIDYFTA